MRIGVNINQIAHKANATSHISKKAIYNIQKDINDIKSTIINTLTLCE